MTRLVRSTPVKRRSRAKGRTWPLQDAKARFSELVRHARENGPQRITVHGKDAAVLVSAEDFASLTGSAKAPTLRALLENSPLSDVIFEFEPVRVVVRPVEL